jgi:DNA helicase HerA-like ATPase
VYEHIENVLNCFRAAVPMFDPLPAIFGEALERVYGFDRRDERAPSMAELTAAARDVLASKRYAGEVESNLKAALDVRLGMLNRRTIGRVLQCRRDCPPIADLVRSFSIIELAELPPEQACLVTLFILTRIRELIKPTKSDEKLRLVIVLEEAHNIVGRVQQGAHTEGQADPRAYATEFVCRMLAELRALGVAIIIVDQLPSAIAPEVLKNTASKLAFRQVATEDRHSLGGTMLFGELELEEMARLRPGDAFFFTEGYFGPRRIVTPNVELAFAIPGPPIGADILEHITADGWFVDAARTRVYTTLEQLASELSRFERTLHGAAIPFE